MIEHLYKEQEYPKNEIVQSVVDVASAHSIVEKHPAKGFEKKLEKILKKTGFKTKYTKKNYKTLQR